MQKVHKCYPLPSSIHPHSTVECPSIKITYLLSILLAEEASKAATKHKLISSSFIILDKAPWDTMKTQLLVAINTVCSPQNLAFNNYTLMFFISRILPKPGMALWTEEHYKALLLCAGNITSKTATVNLMIQEKKKTIGKENAPASAELGAGMKAKKVSACYQ